MSVRDAVLATIKDRRLVSAKEIAGELGIGEKAARSAIDRLRTQGEPIWNDPDRDAFWWRDDVAPGNVAYSRWKRSFE
jgi:hypothetical protein